MNLFSLVTQAWTRVSRDFANRAAARDLHAMTDHQLADIGISRDQIDTVVTATPADRRQPQARPVNVPLFSSTIRA